MPDDQPTKVINVRATLRMLKRKGAADIVGRLPSGIIGQRRKLREVCQRLGIEPIYEQD